ncbi:MAG: glycosyltransferase family 39 protein [Candidatus Omnitrophica bacterium]|nr:glycosyltransferase family 39 protein [Candidatus Omnitrophota bacterium]
MNKKTIFFLFFIILLGAILRIINLGRHSFWCDEFLAISLGKHSIKWIINFITFNDAHPPLFYIMVHFWLKLGQSEFILRILPLIFGIMCIPLGYILGKKFNSEKTGLLLSLFISLSPPLILWSQLVKSYSLFTLLTIISFYVFLNFLEQQDRKSKIILILLNVLILYTHNLGFIVILIQFIFAIFSKKINLKFIYVYLITFLFYIPWFIRIPYQIRFTLGVIRPLPISLRIPYTLFYFFLGETINPFNFKILVPIFLIYSITFIISLKNVFLLEKNKKYFIGISLVLPLFFVFFRSTVPQNLIPFSIFWFLFYAIGTEKLSKKNIISYLVFISTFPSLFFYFTDNVSQYHDASKLIPFREIYKEIEKLEGKSDLVFTTEKIEKDLISPIFWYYKGKSQIIEIKSKNDLDKIIKLMKDKENFFLILDFVNSAEISEEAKKFFEKQFEKIYEKKYVYNEKLLNKLKGESQYYYLLEIYIFKKK